MFSVWNGLLYTAGWFSCIWFASLGMPKLAFLSALAPYLMQMALFFYAKFPFRLVDAFLGIYALLMGFGLETLIVSSGLVHYITSPSTAYFPPLWILALYPLFSTTLNHSLAIVNTHKTFPFLCGLIAPLSYLAGGRLGACTFPYGFVIAYMGLALLWILLMYAIVAINRSLAYTNTQIEHEFQNQQAAAMLYDGECPLCAREVHLLQTSNPEANLSYVDIASKNYEPGKFQNLSYQQAMKQLYVVSDKGEILKGVDAFFRLYAKIGWKGLAMALKAPIFHQIFQGLYHLFARYRLLLTGRS